MAPGKPVKQRQTHKIDNRHVVTKEGAGGWSLRLVDANYYQ